MVNLPPLSGSQFSEKVLETQREAVENDKVVEAHCNICQKSYSSAGALQSHLNSKKHQEIAKKRTATTSPTSVETGADDDSSIYTTTSSAAAFSQTTDTSSLSSSKQPSFRIRLGMAQTEQEIDEILTEKLESAVRLTSSHCLFCTTVSTDMMECIEHMAKSHSFFIPDAEFLVDPAGLLQYLGDKISVANVCIYCNGKGKSFHSLEAVRAHMVGKGHCKIPFEDGDEDEIAEFYEFGGEKDEDSWEEVGEDDLRDSDSDDEVEEIDLDEDAFTGKEKKGVVFTDAELILPSGIRIGHRSFRRYWNQNLRPVEITPGSMRDPNMQSRITSRYQSLGQQLVRLPGGGSGVLTRTERLQMKVEKREARRRLVHQQDHTARVGQKHNMLQHHYREQNPF